MATWFLIDLLGAFPFERFIRAEAKSRKSIKLVKYFKIPKLLRISRIMKYVRNHKYVYDIVQVFFLVFTLLHVGACTWMLALDPCDEFNLESYAGPEVCSMDNIYYLYIEAFHISAVMMLGISNFHIAGSPDMVDMFIQRHDGDKVRLYIVSTLYMVGGLFVVALLMSEMNVYLMAKMQGSAAFQRLTDRVKHEMEYYGVPDDLQRQVRAFYDYVWIHQKQYDDKIALLSDQQMSTDLQRKLALHLFKDVVSHISFFSEVDDLLLGEICLSLKTRIFLPNDMILFKGDTGKELFIIAKGVVEVLRDDLPPSERCKTPPILLRNGSFFGEIALVMEVRRTCSVQARTICEVNVLQQQAFDAILRENPDFARRINELVVARQLESCLTRSKQKGLDFKVAESDLERAVDAVEKNMQKGLERRMMTEGNLYAQGNSGLNRIQEINKEEFGPQRPSPLPQPRGDSSRSIQVPPPEIASKSENDETPSKEAVPKANQRSGSRFGSTSAVSAASDVSEIFRDITRRSTRFADEQPVQMAPLHGKSCRHNKQEETPRLDDSDKSAGAYSDGEFEVPREQRKKWWRKRRRKERGSHDGRMSLSSEGMPSWDIGGEDSETDVVTGHFHPGQMVDINSVRSAVLQSARLDERQDDQIARLDVRLGAQDQMMKLLLDKLEVFEEREMRQQGDRYRSSLRGSGGGGSWRKSQRTATDNINRTLHARYHLNSVKLCLTAS